MAKPKTPNAATIQADESTAHVVALLRVGSTFRDEALSVLKDLERELVRAVEDATPGSASQQRAQAMLREAGQIIEAAYKTMTRAQVKNLEGVALIENKQVATMQNRAVGVDIFTPRLATTALEALVRKPIVFGHPAADWWNGQAVDLQRRFVGQMQMGILRGETTAQLIDRIRGTKARGFTDGVMNVSKTQAETLVRTSVQSVSNATRLASFEAQPDLIKAIEWVSTLDTRTSDICKALDGCTWDLPNYKPSKGDKAFPGPVAHYRCRSTQVAVTKSWEELAGIKLPTLDNRTIQAAIDDKLREGGKTPEQIAAAKAFARASMDGQVSAETDFNGFVKRKGGDFANQVLGAGRAELWTAGKITMRDLTDQNNRPLSLEELRRAVATATVPPETAGRKVEPTPPPRTPTAAPPPDAETVTAISAAAQALTLDDLRRNGLPTNQAELDIVRMAHAIVGGGEAPSITPGDAARIAALKPAELQLFNAAKARRYEYVRLESERRAAKWMAESAARPVPPRQSPVSNALTTPARKVEPILKHALDNIDRVIDDGGLPQIVVKGGARDANGVYEFRHHIPVEIRLNLQARGGAAGLPATAVHEIGHFLHHQFFGLQSADYWDTLKATKPFFDAVRETNTHKNLKHAADRFNNFSGIPAKQIRYLADPREVFTRAFTQWIAEESQDPLLLHELALDKASLYGELMHWPPAEMATLAEAFRAMFAKTYRTS